jgi:hypothetical protein
MRRDLTREACYGRVDPVKITSSAPASPRTRASEEGAIFRHNGLTIVIADCRRRPL